MKKLSKAVALTLVFGVSATFVACNSNINSQQTTTQPVTVFTSALSELHSEESSTTSVASVSKPTSGLASTTAVHTTADPLVGNNKANIVAYYNKAIDLTNRTANIRGTDNMKVNNIQLNGSYSKILDAAVVPVLKAAYHPQVYKRLPPFDQGKSAIKASDIASASCTKSGNNYIIKLTAVPENNAVAGKSPHGRMFNLIDTLSHEITSRVKFTGDVSKDLQMKYSNSAITAVINSKTGKITKLTSDLNIDLFMRNCSFIIKINEKGAGCKINMHEEYTIT